MKKYNKASFDFENVYIIEGATVASKKEYDGPYGRYFDLIIGKDKGNKESFEKEEIAMQKQAYEMLLTKSNILETEIDCILSGDLLNQLGASTYSLKEKNVPWIGVFAACSTITLSLALAAMLTEKRIVDNVICMASSSNRTAERQFRSPLEYGGKKALTQQNTVTGCGACLVSFSGSTIKISEATIGIIHDSGLNSPLDLGRSMAASCMDTLVRHLKYRNKKVTDYDLIVTGDLGYYGRSLFLELAKLHDIELHNYIDAGCEIYGKVNEKTTNKIGARCSGTGNGTGNGTGKGAGGSGAGCISIILLGKILKNLQHGVYKKVLCIATGSLLNTTLTLQHETIPAISHAVCLERVIS